MNICVYGASSNKIDSAHIAAGERLGEYMAERGHTLIFGGGANGMMGAAARGMDRKGGKIIGVAPTFFNVDGILFERCTELIGTETMRERKQKMEDLSDAFIMTAGGIGTFEEFFEILTLKQLSRHKKAIVILNTEGYFNSLIEMMENAVKGQFMSKESLSLYKVAKTAEDAVAYIEKYVADDGDITRYKNI